MNVLQLPPSLRRVILNTPVIPWRTAGNNVRLGCRGLSQHSARNAAPEPPPLAPDQPGLLTLSPSTLNNYEISIPPTVPQLKYSHRYCASASPLFLYSAATFRSLPPSPHPEVAFLGRSNVGKSSLLNALFGRPNARNAHVSKRPGRTRTMNGWGVTGGLPLGAAPKEGQREAAWKRFPRGGCVVVDMPGYGGGSHEEWGKEILKYLQQRKQLRRTFVLVDTEHGLKRSDISLLMHLRSHGISHQIVLSKVDKLIYPGAKPPGPGRLSADLMRLKDLCAGIRQRLNEEAGDGREHLLDILCASSEKGLDERSKSRRIGVDEVRWAVLSACGLECDEHGQRKTAPPPQDITVLDENDF
ncbi:hypothetical protein KC356_g2707 [Hortaea werneckii]|nr:hypothetical protein KC356_g2707 [Hortaea werneckii]